MNYRDIILMIFTVWLCSSGTKTTAQQIAITLDDLPYVMPSQTSPNDGLAYVNAINSALASHNIISVGFTVGQQINPQTEPALRAFVEAGHQLGNHSWSHADYSNLSKRAFRREVRRTDDVLRDWQAETKYFRFPYLREGATDRAKSKADAVLTEFGYVNVPVSIDNDEWQFNADYISAIEAGRHDAAQQIGRQYVAHMQERTLYFQALANDVVCRDVAHILLLHMNRINADFLQELLDWYSAKGWSFITVEQALRDPIYQAKDRYAGHRGLSQIERVSGITAD